jgi:hypothetical protein
MQITNIMGLSTYVLEKELAGLRVELEETQKHYWQYEGAIQAIEQLIELSKQPDPVLPISFASYVKPGDNPPPEEMAEDDPEDEPT